MNRALIAALLLALPTSPAMSQPNQTTGNGALEQEVESLIESWDEPTRRRMLFRCSQFSSEIHEYVEIFKQNDWWDTLFLGRIEGSYSFGEGLTVKDVTGTDRTFTTEDKSSWSVSYKLPLSLIRRKRATDRHAERDLDKLRFAHALIAEETSVMMTSKRLARDEARDLFQECSTAGQKSCTKEWYALRRAQDEFDKLSHPYIEPGSIKCRARSKEFWNASLYNFCCESPRYRTFRSVTH